METGRQTRRKTNSQSTLPQSSSVSNIQKETQETQNDLSPPILSAKSSSEEKSQNSKMKATMNQFPLEKRSFGLEASEFSSEVQQHHKPTNSYQENEKKVYQSKKERQFSTSDINTDLSPDTKKQLEMLFEIAQSLASKGDYHQAIHIYNKIVKLNEKSTAAWIAIGHCNAMLGDNFQALSSYQQALSITSESQRDDQLWYGIGILYQKTGDWKNAETSFKNALQLNPKSSLKGDIYYNLGIIMKTQGDSKGAIRMLMSSITCGTFSIDKMVEVLCAVGQAQEELDEVTEAMKIYKQALTLDENNLKALQCAGWLSFQLDRTPEALDYLTKASLISEDDSNIWFMQARCFLKQKQHNKAYEYLSNCLKKDQTNSMYWNSLGILFGEMNQLKSSHECLSNALKFGYSIAENYFNMGCLYELCSQFGDAIAMYDKAIELQPNFQLAYTRKLGVHFAQTENKKDTLSEVKFKHHKFTLKLDKDTRNNKSLLSVSQTGQIRNLNNDPKNFGYKLISNEDEQNFSQRIPLNQELSEPVFSNAFQLANPLSGPNMNLIKGNSYCLGEDYNLESLDNIKENNFSNEQIGNIKISTKPQKMKAPKSFSKENFLQKDLKDLQLLQEMNKLESLHLTKPQSKNELQKSKEEDPLPEKKVKSNPIVSKTNRNEDNPQEMGIRKTKV